MPGSPSTSTATVQIAAFLARYDSAIGHLASDARVRLRQRMPSAVELVYDNYNALVFGYGPTERASDAILSLALYPKWVRLFFLRGTALPDPANLLSGTGTQVRSIRLKSAADIELPAIQTLISEAIRQSAVPLPEEGLGSTIIKSISAKQRPRRSGVG